MSNMADEGEPRPSYQELLGQLEEAKATIRALTSGNVDAVLDSEHSNAILLGEAQAALRASEELHRLVLENSTDAVFLTDAHGQFTFISPNVSRVFDYSFEEVKALGKMENLLGVDIIKDKDFDEHDELSGIEFPIAGKNGSTRELLITVRKVTIQDGVYLYTCKDNTERNSLQRQLLQAQKMEAVGQLSAGVAHDFNNIMTVVTGYGNLILGKLKPEDPISHQVNSMVQAGNRATILTRKLLAFGRKQVLIPEIFSINEAVEGMKDMIVRAIRESIEVQFELDATAGSVKADKNQLEQVILNLALNARDAMPGGGLLTFRTQNVDIAHEYAARHLEVEPGTYVLLEVSDTGTGIEKDMLGRIFEPFYTTKPFGKGTGLGLSTCMGFARQSGGRLTVDSELGVGSTFKLYLQRVDSKKKKGKVASSSLESTSKGTETILVVEDEPELMQLTQMVLEQGGYRVFTASRGAMAIKLAAQYKNVIRLLLTDMVLPAMSGRELANQMKASMPNLNVLFMSGYTNDILLHHGTLPENESFLEKPFTPQVLLQRVREALDG